MRRLVCDLDEARASHEGSGGRFAWPAKRKSAEQTSRRLPVVQRGHLMSAGRDDSYHAKALATWDPVRRLLLVECTACPTRDRRPKRAPAA